LCRVMSIVKFAGEVEIMLAGESATFFCIVMDGTLISEDGTKYEAGAIVGYEGLFKDNYHRPNKLVGGLMGGVLGIFMYSELGRALLFDGDVIAEISKVICGLSGGVDETLRASMDEFGDKDEAHGAAEERFIAQQKHSKKMDDEEAKRKSEKELSASKQRDHKIYLTQEVWAKRDSITREGVKFLNGVLTRNVNNRLGCGPGGFGHVKEHEWFENIDWDKLEEGNATAPYIPKKEVNAKEEGKMKTFNTAGMKKLTAENQAKWADWDWTSTEYFKKEMAAYLYEQWGITDSKRGRVGAGGSGGSGGCCEIA